METSDQYRLFKAAHPVLASDLNILREVFTHLEYGNSIEAWKASWLLSNEMTPVYQAFVQAVKELGYEYDI